jgi:ubiquitin-like 1-activating enzyme E1 B
LKLKKLSLEE